MSALEDSLRKVYKLPSVGSDRFATMMKKAQENPRLIGGSALPTGMVPGMRKTMEFRDFNQNGIEDRAEGIYMEKDLVPEDSLPPQMNYPDAFNVMPEGGMSTMPSDQDPMDEMDEETRQRLDELLGKAAAQQMAPMAPLAEQLKAAGTGEDTALAHLRPGEIVIPPEFMEDDEFEGALERKFREFNINPEEAVVGMGIASLNPQTGLEQFGFFKKIFKGIKKVVKKVAPVAMLIPGVGTALGGVLGGIGGLATKIPGIGGALGKIGSTVMGGIANLGIPGISSIAGGTAGGFGGIKGALTTKAGLFGGGPFSGLAGAPDYYAGGPGSDPESIAKQQVKTQLEQARAQALASGNMEDVAKIDAYLAMPENQVAETGMFGGTLGPKLRNFFLGTGQGQGQGQVGGGLGGLLGGGGGSGLGGFAKDLGIGALAAGLGKLAYEDAKKQKGVPLTPMVMESPTGRYNIEAEIARRQGLAAPNPVEFGLLPEGTIPELSGGQPRMAYMGGAVEDLTGGMARGLREGGPVNPGVSTEEAAMQFIIRAEQDPRLKNTPEYEVARSVLQMLKQRSGSMFTNQEMEQEIVRQLRPRSGNLIQQSEIDDVKKGIASMPAMMYGGPVMAYAQGGAVQMQEGGGMDPSQFPRMDGDINGPGTETSDDIPAMLSDGEFVMTGQAVRGAGSYDMAMDPKGIISLVPSFEEDRERGMDLMYKMMDAFSTNAESS